MKMNKKFFVRIGAVLACVLLVGALAVPAFADESSAVAYMPSYGDAIDTFQMLLDSRSDTLAYGGLLTYYNGFGDSRFFNVKTLVSGSCDVNYSPTYIDDLSYLNSMDSGDIRSTFTLDRFEYAVYSDADTLLIAGGAVGSLTFTQMKTQETASTISIAFYDGSSANPSLQFNYSTVDHSGGADVTFTKLYVGSASYNPSDIYRVEVAFAVNNNSTPYMLPVVCSLLYLNDAVYYEDVVYSPSDFYKGYTASYNLGYEDGNRYGYQNGYDDGYDQGVIDTKGDDIYQSGYDAAVQEIKDGDFGRNFLGNVFGAPVDALRRFTLVDWTLKDGTLITINLMSVFSAIVGVSLFVWFLKMFSGG